MTDYTIPPGVARIAHKALLKAEEGHFNIDDDDLTTASILVYDGEIDDREAERQIKFFNDDKEYGHLCEEADRGTTFYIVWRLHGGSTARRWLKQISDYGRILLDD